MSLILEQVSKVYNDGPRAYKALDQVSLQVNPGEFVGVVGPSGSGKSTLLSVMGMLLAPTSGRVILDGKDTANLSSKELTELRLEKIGFIFQAAHLIPYLKVRDQLQVINVMAKKQGREGERKAQELLEHFGLAKRVNNYPKALSGGERQRVAIARALINDPQMILADEPTASLDSKRGRDVVETLAKEIKTRHKIGVMVTHDERVLDLCDRIITIKDGQLVKEDEKTEQGIGC